MSFVSEIKQNPSRVIIFDTTLRDGEQSPGCSMTLEEKLKIAHLLEDLGVDVIEAGFPIASPGDFESVQAVANAMKKSVVAGLARAKQPDIEAAGAAIKGAARGRIHTFISTSPIHMQYQINMTEEQVLEAIAWSVKLARNYTDDVEWSGMDATRSDMDFLCRCIETAIASGASTINIPDTVGYAVPSEFGATIKSLIERVQNSDQAIFSVHCHNDLGLAVANSLAGLEAGARQIECTINGIGERAGNAALEEAVMAMKVRGDHLGLTTNIDATKITRVSRALSSIISFPVQPNKAIVGANAFAHESGIHQDGMLKHKGTYEIMTPESVGLQASNIVLGKHSGRHAFKKKLESLGYGLGDNALQDAFARFKQLADRKKEIFDEDLIALVDDEMAGEGNAVKLVALNVQSGTEGPQTARLTLTVEGEEMTAETVGNGPVDAIFNAFRHIVPHPEAKLTHFHIHAITVGTDAQAEVSVRLEERGKSVNGQGSDTDTLVACARAYLTALNKLLTKRRKTKPQDEAAE